MVTSKFSISKNTRIQSIFSGFFCCCENQTHDRETSVHAKKRTHTNPGKMTKMNCTNTALWPIKNNHSFDGVARQLKTLILNKCYDFELTIPS